MVGIALTLLVQFGAGLAPYGAQMDPDWLGLEDSSSLTLLQLRSMLVPPGHAEPERSILSADFSDGGQAAAIRQEETVLSVYDPMQLVVSTGFQEKEAVLPEKEVGRLPRYAYPLAMLGVVLMISVIYWERGVAVILKIVVYLFALSTMKLSVKCVLATQGFMFPKLITALHLATSSLLGFAVLFYLRATAGRPIIVPTWGELLAILPIALSFALSIGATNLALGIATVSFTEIVGATQPLFSVAVLVASGVHFDRWLFLPVCVVVLGCGLTVTGEADFSWVGLLLVGTGNMARAVKGVGQQLLMTGAAKERFEPVPLLAWTCLVAAVIMSVWSAFTEGASPYRKLQSQEHVSGALIAIGISAMNACVLNLSQLFVVQELGAVGLILVGQSKAVLTVMGGIALFGEVVSKSECVGFAVVLLGTFAYSTMDRALKEKALRKGRGPAGTAEPMGSGRAADRSALPS